MDINGERFDYVWISKWILMNYCLDIDRLPGSDSAGSAAESTPAPVFPPVCEIVMCLTQILIATGRESRDPGPKETIEKSAK